MKNKNNKNKNKNKNNKNNKNNTILPFVSICTPTFNRRPFISSLIACYNHQIYPKDRMEWIIVDDGTDKIEDLVTHLSCVKYIKLDEKITLGKKRNLMHEHCSGDIIVYMDDDDYYPPTRVSHAVEKLVANKNILMAGSSELYIYFKHINKMWQFGPYGPNHATAGTFAFKKELLKITKYNEDKSLGEEKEFLQNFSIPLIQLDPQHVILVFSHIHNTFDKKILLETPSNQFAKPSNKTIDYFIKESELKDWYLNQIESALNLYEPGLPIHKPDVLTQIQSVQKLRQQQNQQNQQNRQNQQNNIITLHYKDRPSVHLSHNQITQLLKEQQNKIRELLDINKKILDKNQIFIDILNDCLGEENLPNRTQIKIRSILD